MTRKEKIAAIGGTAIVVVGLYLATKAAAPLPSVVINTKLNPNYQCVPGQESQAGCMNLTHEMRWAYGCPTEAAPIPAHSNCVYSGNFIVHTQQWGVWVVDVTKSTWSISSGLMSPITNQGPGFQPAVICRGNGDFHAASKSIAASQGEAKWVISTTDNPQIGTCAEATTNPNPPPQKINPYLGDVQVYSLSSGGLIYKGQVAAGAQGTQHRIIGDIAYVDLGNGQWTPINLPSCTRTGCETFGNVAAIPAGYVPQATIQGWTYTIQPSTNPWPESQQKATLVGKAPVQPTPTVVPPTVVPTAPPIILTPTPAGPNPYASYIEGIYNDCITKGCSANPKLFCPKNTMTREEVAVFIYRSMHGCSAPPPPCTGVFQDVPCGPTAEKMTD